MITTERKDDRTLQGQEKRYNVLTNVLPQRIVIFIICAYCNVSYRSDIEAESWTDYIKKVQNKEGYIPRFFDGITDIRTVLRDNLDNSERWIAEWGKGDDDRPYTTDDYKRLDEIFSTMSSRLDRSGGMDALQDMTLHNCARRQLLADKKLAKGTKESVDIASKLLTMNQKDLEAEQLRGKDRVATEEITVPGIVEALKKKGVSAEMSMEDAVAFINKVTKQKHYNMSLDAADHVLEIIINTMRKNNDEPELEELPLNMRFDPRYGGEFTADPEEWETDAFKYLGITRRDPGYFRGEKVEILPPDIADP